MSLPLFVILLIAVPLVFAVLDLAEGYHARRQAHSAGPGIATVSFLVGVLLVYGLLQWAGFAAVPGLETLLRHGREAFRPWLGSVSTGQPLHPLGLFLLVSLMFYVSGLWDYLLHRFVSHSRWLWFTHEYHHLPNRVFVLAPGVAARPFAVVSTFPVALATLFSAQLLLACFGLPLADQTPVRILILLQLGVLTASHASCLRRWVWVHMVLKRLAITTPQEHVLHHTIDLQGNYGNFTTLWDRCFGTYLDPSRPENRGHPLGLAYDQDFLGTLTLGTVKLPPRLRQHFQVGRYCNLFDRGAESEKVS